MKQDYETIYLETGEEITFIIGRLRKSKARKITLVVPKKAKLFQSVINLKILKEQSEKLKKDIVIITTDKAGKNMASKAGLAIHRQIRLSENPPIKEKAMKAGDEQEKQEETVTDRPKNQVENQLSDIGGIKIGKEDKIIHLEKRENSQLKNSKEFQNQKEEILISNDRKIKRTKIFDMARKENNSGKGENLEVNSPSFNNHKKEFNLFGDHLAKDQTVSLLPTLSARFFAVFIFACLAISAIAASFILPEAKVDIFLKKERVSNNFKFTVDKNIIEPDIQLNKLPANAIEVVSKESSEFPATGKKQLNEKASGMIIIYNEYSTSPQSLIANTRFLSKEGKIFKIRKKIAIPGFTKPDDKIVPGTVETEIFAEKAGENYNIGPTSFTVPAFQEMGSPKYSGIYARSTAAMTGGSTKEVSVITKADISKAQKTLLESLKKKNSLGIENEISENDKLIGGTREDEIAKVELSNKAGDQVEKAAITIEVSSKVLIVKQKDINVLADHNFNSDLSDKMKLISESKKIECGDSYLDEDKKIIFPVYVEQEAVRIINPDQIKRDIIGKDEQELRKFFSEMDGIKTVNIGFWPFWVKNVPQSVKKIKIRVNPD